jgi:hypothetical protein
MIDDYDEVLKYLQKRISNPTTYRGMHLAQHQRLWIEKFDVIVGSIYKVAGETAFIEPAGDDPIPSRTHKYGSPRRTPASMSEKECRMYWDILDEIARMDVKDVGASFNSLKKNTFPNLEKMGILQRIPRAQQGEAKTAKLTPEALKFINGNGRERVKIYSEATEKLLVPVFEVLDTALSRFDSVNVYELMLFLTDNQTDIANRVKNLSKYKRLKRLQIVRLHDEIKKAMDKKMGSNIPKKEKLDWHNWWNESKQIIAMLRDVVGYSVVNDDLVMKPGAAKVEVFTKVRSQKVKNDSLQWQGLSVINGWELHHIVPIDYAVSSKDLEMIDDKRNLLYIPQSIHRRIPNTANLQVQFSYDATHVILKNPLSLDGKPLIEIAWPRDSGVAQENLEAMVKYNQKLLDLVIA